MKVISSSIVDENPFLQLRSRQDFFPFVFEINDGTFAMVHAIGETFESVDSSSYISFS